MRTNGFIMILALSVSCVAAISATTFAGDNDTIIELWDKAKAPPPVEIKDVKVDPSTTAFLVLDIEELTCNPERRPRCIAAVPRISAFLKRARMHNLAVVYSLTPRGTPATILPPVAPLQGEPVVNSSVDKFFNTKLEEILRARGIKTVIIAGTTAEGAVVHTATGASMRGFKVVVAVDGMPAGTLYAEQYTAWHLLNAPGTRRSTVLSSFERIEF